MKLRNKQNHRNAAVAVAARPSTGIVRYRLLMQLFVLKSQRTRTAAQKVTLPTTENRKQTAK